MIRHRARRNASTRLCETLEARTLFSTTISTTTSLDASAAALSVGQTLTFTASVAADDTSLDGQWVQLWDNNTLFVGSAQLTNNSVTINWTPLTEGLHSISAEFPAQDNFDRSVSSPQFINVFRRLAAVTLSTISLAGGITQLQVAASATEILSVSPTGKVDIFDNTQLLATITLGSADTLALKLSQGTHLLTASYRGDGAFFPASTSQSVTLKAPPATTQTPVLEAPVLNHSHQTVVIHLPSIAGKNPTSANDSISAYLAPQSRQYYGPRPKNISDPTHLIAVQDELLATETPQP